MAAKSSIFDVGHLSGEITAIGQLNAKLSNGTGGTYPFYDGPYTVIPDAQYDQTLETSMKVLKEDVTVTKVPFHETHNDYGTTVYIAMEVENG